MRNIGIDIGSRTLKVVLLVDGLVEVERKRVNSFDTAADCRQILEGLEWDAITATGYGRHLFARLYPEAKVISEIKAFALGVNHLFPACRTILDIGGQDTKAIAIDARGGIRKFEMNDKCAAGTGRFLEIMAMTLGSSLGEFGDLAMQAPEPHKINSMCTVFAESEVVSSLSNGVCREAIARGVLQTIVTRGIGLLRRVGMMEGELAFVGGVALNSAMRQLLAAETGRTVVAPTDPQIVGALGAALSC